MKSSGDNYISRYFKYLEISRYFIGGTLTTSIFECLQIRQIIPCFSLPKRVQSNGITHFLIWRHSKIDVVRVPLWNIEIFEISRYVIISRGLHLQTLFLMWLWISIKNAFQPYIMLLYLLRFFFHFPIWRHRMWKRKIQFSSEDFIFRPCFYCDSESARRDGFNDIYHDYIWNEKYFFNYDIIRYCDVISGTLQKWPYCYFENLSHTNSYPTIRLQITFCTRLPGPKKTPKKGISPFPPPPNLGLFGWVFKNRSRAH